MNFISCCRRLSTRFTHAETPTNNYLLDFAWVGSKTLVEDLTKFQFNSVRPTKFDRTLFTYTTSSTEALSKTPFFALSTVVPALIPSSSNSEIPTSASVPAIGVSDVKMVNLNVDITVRNLRNYKLLLYITVFSSERSFLRFCTRSFFNLKTRGH